jgi:hypothetical protein
MRRGPGANRPRASRSPTRARRRRSSRDHDPDLIVIARGDEPAPVVLVRHSPHTNETSRGAPAEPVLGAFVRSWTTSQRAPRFRERYDGSEPREKTNEFRRRAARGNIFCCADDSPGASADQAIEPLRNAVVARLKLPGARLSRAVRSSGIRTAPRGSTRRVGRAPERVRRRCYKRSCRKTSSLPWPRPSGGLTTAKRASLHVRLRFGGHRRRRIYASFGSRGLYALTWMGAWCGRRTSGT